MLYLRTIKKRMKVSSISLLASNKFSSKVQSWASSVASEVHLVNDKAGDFYETTDSLLIFNQNQELGQEVMEIKARYDKQQKPVHKIDINGRWEGSGNSNWTHGIRAVVGIGNYQRILSSCCID